MMFCFTEEWSLTDAHLWMVQQFRQEQVTQVTSPTLLGADALRLPFTRWQWAQGNSEAHLGTGVKSFLKLQLLIEMQKPLENANFPSFEVINNFCSTKPQEGQES